MHWREKWKKALEKHTGLAAAAMEMVDDHQSAMREMNSLRVDLILMEGRAQRAEAECERLKRLLRTSRPPKRQRYPGRFRRRRR